MKHQIYRTVVALGIFLGLAVVGVHAQAPSKVKVNIPFEFSAGKTTLPAGVYSIRRMSGNGVLVRSEDGRSSVILNAPATHSSRDPKAIERLVFERYGDQYALSQIWLTADTGRRVWTGRKGQKSERFVVALRGNHGQ